MNKLKFLFLSLLFTAVVFTSCKKDDDSTPAIKESELLVNYLESATSPSGKDYVNTDMPSIISATDVNSLNLTNQIYIIDIRSAEDFATKGHIANAHNVAFADLLTHVKTINMASYEKVAVVCYTGQTAAYGVSLLRQLGYSKVFSMKWGMCSWNETFATGKWSSATSNQFASQFTTNATAKNAKVELPSITTGEVTPQAILEARVNALLTEGFGAASVTNQTVFGALSSYYIVNYWPVAEYNSPGHIPGAVQYTPKESMKYTVDLTTLPTDKPIAVYCYTGQTSAFLAAYLRLLGYDAKSILYGANGMIYDVMPGTKFSATEIKGYDYVTGN